MNNQFKLCIGCKKIIPKDTFKSLCDSCRSYRKKEYQGTGSKVYNSNRWKKVRNKIRKENVFCEVCSEVGGIKNLATEVHHIVKITMGIESTYYDENNLISVCHEHHKMIEGLNKEELIEALQNGSLIIERE